MATLQRVQIPSAEKVYDGTGKTLDEAIKDAHSKIPRHPKGHGFNKQTNEVTGRLEGTADMAISCTVIEIRYESGGIGGAAMFHVRALED